MEHDAKLLRARLENGEVVTNLGNWLPCAKRWLKHAVERGDVYSRPSAWPDQRPEYFMPEKS